MEISRILRKFDESLIRMKSSEPILKRVQCRASYGIARGGSFPPSQTGAQDRPTCIVVSDRERKEHQRGLHTCK